MSDLVNFAKKEGRDSIIRGNMSFDVMEKDMNSGDEAMFDHIRNEDDRMIVSVFEEAEGAVWTAPPNSSDTKSPWGIPYWLTQNATVGFNGGNHASFSAGKAGISSVDYSRHQNFTGAYESYDDQADTGLITIMEEAATKCNWVSPVPERETGRAGYSKVIFLDYDTKYGLKNVSKSNNDSLGFDLSTPEPVFRGAPLRWAPYLEADLGFHTNGPVYMIDTNTFYAVFLKDWFMKRIEIAKLPNQPTVYGVVIYLVHNFVCHNLRKQAVLYNSTL
jgi:hypothetical protein